MLKNKTKIDQQTSTTKIERLSHDGRGIATIANKKIFIAGALPNETVSFQITQKRSSYNLGTITDIVTPSEQRCEPPCVHFGICGGCALQHMHTDLQLSLKQQTLLDQLNHFGKVQPATLLPPISGNNLAYRRKARLGVKYVIKKEKVLVGFREKSSRYLADLTQCEILHPKVGHRLIELAELVRSLTIYQAIPQIEVAIGDSDAALVFRCMQPLTFEDREILINYGKTHDFHIYIQPNSPAAIEKIYPNTAGQRLRYTLPDQGLEFLFHPLDFTQINLETNRLMVNQALKLLNVTSEEKVLDLFCGIGNFTLALAKLAAHVTGIEGEPEMVARAMENAAHNHIENVTFTTTNLMADHQVAAWTKKNYDKILLDPPRAGAKEILPLLANLGATRIVYVSCNPATLARDAGELVHNYGYQLKEVGVINMFPHTAHIEAMAVFDKPAA